MAKEKTSESGSNGLSILARIGVLAAALGIPIANQTRHETSEVMNLDIHTTTPKAEKDTASNLPLSPTLDQEKAEFRLPNETFSEAGVKPTMVEAAKEFPGYKFIGKFEGNGGRDALIYIPEGFDPNKPVELVYHFHGTNGELIDEVYSPRPNTNKRYQRWVKEKKIAVGGNRLKQILTEALEGQKEGRNYIVVYPLSHGQRGPAGSAAEKNAYDAYWMQKGNSTKDDMEKLDLHVRETLTDKMKLSDLKIGKITVKGHSAGGQPLKNILRSGFKPDRVDFLDASYGDWTSVAYQAALKNNPDIEFNVFTIPGTDTPKHISGLKGKAGVILVDAVQPHAQMNENYFNWQRPEEKVAEREAKETDHPGTN